LTPGRSGVRTLEALLPHRPPASTLTDQDPPIFPSWVAANTDPSQYDVLGRRYYVNLTVPF